VAGGSSDPVDVVGLDNVTEITAGWFHTCARRADATLWCWGENDGGSLGDGTTDDRAAPTKVVALDDVDTIDAHQWQSCAWHGPGQVSCWGMMPWGRFEAVTEPVQNIELPRANR
jgi:alpha-tubulin suppressor-like RCC1 family protein